MFVTVILDTEYMGMGERHKWFLKNLSHAMENNYFVITHEHLEKYYHEYAENCAERFYQEFEMRRLTDKEYKEIRKGFIPDEIFEKKEKELGSRTECIMYLFQERYLELEQYMIQLIDTELKKRSEEKIEGIFNCLDCFASVKYLGDYYDCPVIPYVFSAIRKVHGYQQTLYMTSMNGNLYSGEEGEKRYKQFKVEKQEELIFSRRELLTMFGKQQNIPLLKLLNCEPEYEIGVCAAAWKVNHNFLKFKYTDDDIYYECKKVYPAKQVKTRMHPLTYDDMGVGREHFRNDPVSFFLSCKRIASVESQILLKAILWNRTVFAKGGFLPFSFLCEKDMKSTKKAEIRALNYYIFGFLVPSEMMFDTNYWKWRIEEHPSEHEIYQRHLAYYIKNLGLEEKSLCSKNETERFSYLLYKRNCPEDLIADLLDEIVPEDLNYEVLYSKLELGRDSTIENHFNRMNHYKDGKVASKFIVECKNTMEFLRFYPFVDIGGKAKINVIKIDGKDILKNKEFVYYPKRNGYIECNNLELSSQRHIIDVEWEYYFP